MFEIDGYIKRIKYLSILVLALTLLTSDIAESGKNLQSNYMELQSYFLFTKLVTAQIPGNGSIIGVDGQLAEEWLKTSKDILSSQGRLVDVIKSWEVNNLSVEGTFKLANGEVVKFRRIPAFGIDDIITSNDLKNKKEVIKYCEKGGLNNCSRYEIQTSDDEIPIEIILVSTESDRQGEESWQYLDTNEGNFIPIDYLESKIIRIAIPWIGTSRHSEEAYIGLRDLLENRLVRIPVVNVDVKATRLSVFISIFSLIISVLMAHSLVVINNSSNYEFSEPWILQTSCTVKNKSLISFLFALRFIGCLTLVGLLWCPVAIVSYAIGMTQAIGLMLLHLVAIVLTIVNAIISTLSITNIFRELHEHALAKRT